MYYPCLSNILGTVTIYGQKYAVRSIVALPPTNCTPRHAELPRCSQRSQMKPQGARTMWSLAGIVLPRPSIGGSQTWLRAATCDLNLISAMSHMSQSLFLRHRAHVINEWTLPWANGDCCEQLDWKVMLHSAEYTVAIDVWAAALPSRGSRFAELRCVKFAATWGGGLHSVRAHQSQTSLRRHLAAPST